MRLLSLLFAIIATTCQAQDGPLDAAELRALLTNNTAIGKWNDDPYRQWFGEDGVTYYAPKGKRSTRGKWRVTENGDYESWWSGNEWERYGVKRVGEGYVWVDPKGKHYPFDLLSGQQLVWTD